jgi:type I restriction enzyme S subunit
MKRYAVAPGDVLVSCVGTFGKVAIVPLGVEPGIINPRLVKLTPRSETVFPDFLAILLRSDPCFQQMDRLSRGGTMDVVNLGMLSELRVCLPPLIEQRRIVAFLRRKTAVVDALIAKKERLIELLQEKRQALITQAVTKGLDPNVPMKDSGIEWLGQIPAHWVASRPKFMCTRIVDGVHSKPSYVDDGVPFVTVKNLTAGDGISFEDIKFITEEDHAEFSRRANPTLGDVLITKDGTLGVCRVVETDRVFSIFVSVAVLKPRTGLLDPYFLRFVLESGVVMTQFESRKAGSGLKHLHLEEIGSVFIPIPPLSEQHLIAAHVRRIHTQHVELSEQIERHIEKLCEYRQALITAAVTGKIDVSKEAA